MFKVQITKWKVFLALIDYLNTKYKAQSTKFKVQSSKYKVQNTNFKI